jgi:uncharacterized protein
LNEDCQLSYIPELIEKKATGKEKAVLPDADMEFFRGEYERLVLELEASGAKSTLPEIPSGKERLNDLLIRLRLREK